MERLIHKLVLIATLAATLSTVLVSAAPTELIYLDGANGPESLAFSPNGEGPYVGVADGRILKWQGDNTGNGVWVPFATTSAQRLACFRPYNPMLEPICGRPLGLKFDKNGNLYIADAYSGLLVVGPQGGLATSLVMQAEGHPLRFTNDLDVDDENNVVYFTDTSLIYQRRNYEGAIWTNDMTGRLIKYDIKTKNVTVLLHGIAFANGVALSKDRSFVLVAESDKSRIIRFWLTGPNAGKHDIFTVLPGSPDNIRTNSDGDFWVAVAFGSEPLAIKLDQKGGVVQAVGGLEMFQSVSQVTEQGGKLWFGSVTMSFVGVRNLP